MWNIWREDDNIQKKCIETVFFSSINWIKSVRNREKWQHFYTRQWIFEF